MIDFIAGQHVIYCSGAPGHDYYRGLDPLGSVTRIDDESQLFHRLPEPNCAGPTAGVAAWPLSQNKWAKKPSCYGASMYDFRRLSVLISAQIEQFLEA